MKKSTAVLSLIVLIIGMEAICAQGGQPYYPTSPPPPPSNKKSPPPPSPPPPYKKSPPPPSPSPPPPSPPPPSPPPPSPPPPSPSPPPPSPPPPSPSPPPPYKKSPPPPPSPPPPSSNKKSPPPPPSPPPPSYKKSPPPPSPPPPSNKKSPPPPPPSPPPPSPSPPPPSPPPPSYKKSPPPPPAPMKPTNVVKLLPFLTILGQQQAICIRSNCHKILVCPEECPKRKHESKTLELCVFDCIKCEATCTSPEGYKLLPYVTGRGQQIAMCTLAQFTKSFHKILVCPQQCPTRKPKYPIKKGCFIDCSNKFEATCKHLKPHCHGYGALCFDPRFVGGDGSMFYFHGHTGGNFAIVSDDKLQINAHFIGSRPQGRKRDFTWVQALSVMFDTHTLVLGAKRVSHWDDDVDSLLVKWDGQEISIPTSGSGDHDAEWRVDSGARQVLVERTGDANSVRVMIAGLAEINLKVVPITEEDNRIHKYQIPDDDAFAHLATEFKFFDLSELVEGILGKTYRPGYVNPAKKGVFMPMLGGEDKYQTPSLDSPDCKVCRFHRQSQLASI